MKAGTVLWIAGASSGIGAAVAREWVRRGGRVALSARRLERLEALVSELGGEPRALAIRCDVTQAGDCERAVAEVTSRWGGIDLAFANAGFGVSAEFEELTDDDYRRQFETNVFGALRVARAAFPELKRTGGLYAVTSSVLGHVSLPGGTPYAMSKFAVRAFAEALRVEWQRHGVGVTLISPGFVASEIRQVDNDGRYHPDARDPVPEWLVVPAEAAAREIADALEARESERIVTRHGKVLVLLNRLFPALVRRFIIPRFATPPGQKGWNRKR
jgi:NAD(P)-dependent dehydrogenase (short-subunit alcohol dehydrogenase family)